MAKKKVEKKTKKKEEDFLSDEDIEKELKKLEDEGAKKKEFEKLPEEYEMGGVKYIREDIAFGEPTEEGKFPFSIFKSGKKKKWYNLWGFFGSGNNKGEGNMLLLMDNEMAIKLYSNVQPGVFRIKEFEGTDYERESYIILKPNKLRTFVDDKGELRRLWIADINNSVALPDEPIYSCKTVSEAIRTAVTDRRNFENAPKEAWWKRYTWLIPAVLIVIYFLWYFGILDNIIASFNSSGAGTQVVETVKDEARNVTGGVVSGLVLIRTKLKRKKKENGRD